jgi:hypothetical protein
MPVRVSVLLPVRKGEPLCACSSRRSSAERAPFHGKPARRAFRKARADGRSHMLLYRRYRFGGMPRRTLRSVLGCTRSAVACAIPRENLVGWGTAWEAGILLGHVEEFPLSGLLPQAESRLHAGFELQLGLISV